MTDKPCKQNERALAKYIGGERIPVPGRASGDAPDIKHNWLSVEVRLRMRIPSWIKEGIAQAKKSAMGKQMPVLIIREKFQKVDDALICMTLKEFRERYL